MDYNRLCASLEKKISKNVGHRADLQLTDTKRINQSTAHFMLAYTGDLPSTEDISQFFIKKFNAKVIPFVSTAKAYPLDQVLTVVGQVLSLTRDIADVKRPTMRPVIEGAVYIDVPLQETWKVTERNGQKVLTRQVKDDIMSMVEARKATMMDIQSQDRNLTFASVVAKKTTDFLAILDKGDVVKALDGDRIIEGTVTKVTPTEVSIKVKASDVSDTTMPRMHVLEVVRRASNSAEKKALVDYYTDAYGDPDYAKQLVK